MSLKIDIQKPICLISDGGILRRRNTLVENISKALQGGAGKVGLVQIREQVIGAQAGPFAAATDEELAVIFERLLPVCAEHGAKLLINGRPDLALQCKLDGVHLNAYAPDSAQCRELLGPDAIIGYSVHGLEEAQALNPDHVDYLLCSPVFQPMSKSSPRPVIGLEGLKVVVQGVSIPVFALGGITPQNTALCREAGAKGVASVSAVFAPTGPARETAELVRAWEGTS